MKNGREFEDKVLKETSKSITADVLVDDVGLPQSENGSTNLATAGAVGKTRKDRDYEPDID
jgi:hypothetical protein